MTIRYISSSVVTSAPGTNAVTAAAGETIITAPGVVIGANGTGTVSGIFGSVTGPLGLQVFNAGLVFGNTSGITLAATPSVRVVVGETGQVISDFRGISLSSTSTNVENMGLIDATDTGIFIESGFSAFVRNEGTISAVNYGIYCFSGNLTVINTGTISASDGLALQQDNIFSASIWNSGTMIGRVLLGDGADLFQGGGTVTGYVDGQGGDDTLIGGDGNDTLIDYSGANWIGGGNGNDTVEISATNLGPGASHVFGGIIGGADTSVNDTLAVFPSGPSGVNIFLSAGAALGSVTRISDGAVAAWINGFENAVGTGLADAIIGSSGANAIEGGNGGDWMVGNGGADRFVFRFAADADAGDQIRDFRRSEGDRIDLSLIDANVSTFESDAFVFRTTRTSNAAAEAVVTNFGNSARVDLYVNADNTVDGTFIVVYGEAGVTSLQATDFIL